MARCKKCNAEIPEGKELCAECEQLNNESYLDNLLHTVASDDQISQEAENARKIRFEKMRAKIDPDRENKPQKLKSPKAEEAESGGQSMEKEALSSLFDGLPVGKVMEEENLLSPSDEPSVEENMEEESLSSLPDDPPTEEVFEGESLQSPSEESSVEENVEEESLSFLPDEPPTEEVFEGESLQSPSEEPSVEEVIEKETLSSPFDKPLIEENVEEEESLSFLPDELLTEEVFEGESLQSPSEEPSVEEVIEEESLSFPPDEPPVEEGIEDAPPSSQTFGLPIGENTEDGNAFSEPLEQFDKKEPSKTKNLGLFEYFIEAEKQSQTDILEPERLEEDNAGEEIMPSEPLSEKPSGVFEDENRDMEEAVPTETDAAMQADFMKENEKDRMDKYMLTPEEEAAFEVDVPDDFIGNGDWENRDYDILSDDTVPGEEFDQMLQDITGDQEAPDEGKGADAFAAADEALQKGGADDGDFRNLMPDVSNEENAADDMDLDIDALLAMNEINENERLAGAAESMFSEPADIEDVMKERNAPVLDGWDDMPGEKEGSMAVPENDEENTLFHEEAGPDGDILDLINSLYTSEEEMPPQESAMSGEHYGTEEDLERSGHFGDIADIFPEDAAASKQMDAGEEEDSGKKKKKKKEKKDGKPGILKRLFGNVKTERSEEEIAQMKEKIIADAEAKEAAEEAKRKKAAADKEAKKKKAEENKAAAAKKKQEAAKKKAEAAKLKKDEKERKKQEVQNLIDAIDEDEGRINRVGASIVFVIFAAAAAFILIGTKVYSYKQSIENAKESFEYKHYNEAYEEIAGLNDIKEDDETFILQVMTVMYTYKQLNSFNHYYEIGQYPQALDSLLKGLRRYDKYSALATIIEIENDMDFVRGEILEQLKDVYSLTEEEAVILSSMGDHEAYAQKVFEIAEKVKAK